jgi:alpha-tubulin suppressor-like RCC1 family protein
VTNSGRVYAWGNNGHGQLGDGSTTNRSSPTLINFSGLQGGETIQQISGGAYHSISVTNSGRVYAWGNNGHGQLGDGSTTNRSSPTLINFSGLQGGETVQMVVAGSYHSLALTTNNRIYTWGTNDYGQLGDGSTTNRSSPTLINFSGLQGGETVQMVVAGSYHSFAGTSNGRIYAWGYNGSGQLGDDTFVSKHRPTLITVS